MKSNAWMILFSPLLAIHGAIGQAATLPAPASDQTTIQIHAGRVSGSIEHDVRVFKGIPFAQPPIGALRWRAPQPVKPWKGVRPATTWGSICMQERKVDPGIGLGEPSEDCLTLNVFAPPASPSLRPVMVYIFGGGFTQGSSSAALFDGAWLARHGVVMVSFNYRLGRFGFFAHPALTNEAKVAPVANYGLMDQIAALQWVHDNIASFGGDSAKVTIFGESAGGISVNNLMISPKARGLFHAAIAESAFGRERTETLVEAEASGMQQAQRWGAASQSADALRNIPASTIVAEDAKDQPFSFFLDGHVPIIDGQIVQESVISGFRAGHEALVPFIIGVNEIELPPAFPPPSLEARAPKYAELPAPLRAQYSSEEEYKHNFLSEAVLTEPASLIAAYHTQRAPTYVYRFAIASDALLKQLGAAPHGSELPYVFQSYASSAFAMGPRDARLGEQFAAYWIDFAKAKNPNGGGRPSWPIFTNDQIMKFTNAGPVPGVDLLAARLKALTVANNNGSLAPLVRDRQHNED